jgi:hypothetical protein
MLSSASIGTIRQTNQAHRISEVVEEIARAKTPSALTEGYVTRLVRDRQRIPTDLGESRLHEVTTRTIREWAR